MTPVRPPHTPDPLNLRGPLDGPRWRRAEPAQSRRPGRSRPGGAPLRYHRTGVGMSRTGHGSRPVPPATTVGLALLAAAITLWLGLVAQFGQMIDGEATVKTFKRAGGQVWLMPHNPAFDPIPGNDATVLGKVVTVIRKV